jgi:thiamine biosynthesis protein ThiS
MITVNGQIINFEEGMTAADALRIAEKPIDAMTLVVVDGIVIPCNQLHNKLLTEDTNIKLLPLMSGG